MSRPPRLSRVASCWAGSFLSTSFPLGSRLARWTARYDHLGRTNHPPIERVAGSEHSRDGSGWKLLAWLVNQGLSLPGVKRLPHRFDSLDSFVFEYRPKLSLNQGDTLRPIGFRERSREGLNRSLKVVERWKNLENGVRPRVAGEISPLLLHSALIIHEICLSTLCQIKIGLALRPRLFQFPS